MDRSACSRWPDARKQGSLLAAVSASTDPAALDYASLFAEEPIDFTSASELAGVVEQRTTYHAGVERRTTTDQAINGGVLASTSSENETYSTSTRADASKRVLSFDDEAGVRYTYVYDALGRVRQVLLPDGRKHTASYDGHGRPSQIVREGIATIDIGYNPVSGLPESKRFSSPSGDLQRTLTWAYDAIGRVTEERYLDSTGASKVYTNYWDGATPLEPWAKTSPGLLTAVTGDDYSKLLEYRVDGALRRRFVSLAGWRSVETSFGYVESGDVGSRTTRVLSGAGVELGRSDWKYEFDSNGRPWHVKLNGAQLVEYGYDADNLLKRATFATGDVINFSYDDTTRRLTGSSQATAAGTVATTQHMGVRGLPDLEKIQLGSTSLSRRYEYWPQRFLKSSTDEQDKYFYAFDRFGLPKQIDRNETSTSIVQSGGTIAAGPLVSRLDSLGRTVARGDLTLEYGPDGQVATARGGPSTWSFVYDEAGQRRLKAAGGTPVAAYLDEGYLDESGLSEPVSVGGRVVGLVRGGAFQTVGTDLRGTVLAEANLTPRVASPFGQRDVHPAVAAAIDYVQKGYDADLGLVRMGVRDYDPEINRFTTPDPLYLERPELCLKSPVECNLYAYARNAPSLFIDPSGKEAMPGVGPLQSLRWMELASDLTQQLTDAFEQRLDKLQAILDAAGLAPGVGTPADVTNSAISAARGNWKSAAINLAGVVGVDLIKVAKLGKVTEAAAALERNAARAGAKAINLPSWSKVTVNISHILERHVPGAIYSKGRDVFPAAMNEKGIMRAIREAYNGAAKVGTQGADRVLLQGEGKGLKIEMWFNKTTKTIETAYPVTK
jgi:RHS repeat-associated protein